MTTFPNVPAPVPYVDSLQSQPIGLDRPVDGGGPRQVTIKVDWSQYLATGYKTIAVVVNLEGGDPAQKLDAIRSIRINNTYSKNTIYILLPDTQQVLVCPPGVLEESVITNARSFVVYSDSMLPGATPVTIIDVLNVNRSGFFTPWRDAGVIGSYIGRTAQTASGASPRIINGVSIGPAAGDRLVVIAAWADPGGAGSITSITSGTMGAIPASQIILSASSARMGIAWYLNDQPATTDNISVFLSANNSVQVFVYSLYNWQNLAPYWFVGTNLILSTGLNFSAYMSEGAFAVVETMNFGASPGGLVIDEVGSAAISAAVVGHYSAAVEGAVSFGPLSSNVIMGGAWR